MKFKTLITALYLTLAACATINPSTNPKEQTVNTVQTYPFLDLNAPNAPRLTAPEVLHRVINFIAHADSPDAFEQQNAEKLLGLKLRNIDKEYPKEFIAKQDFNDIWGWGIRLYETPVNTTLIHKLNFRFFYGNEKIPFTPFCQLDLNDFHREMEKIGIPYQYSGRAGTLYKTFEKKHISQYITSIDVFYVGESMEKIHHDCIKSITVSVFKE